MNNELSILIANTKLPFKESVTLAEDFLIKLPQLPMEVVHHFSPGIYARELRIPAGTVLIGKVHKTEHLCTLSGDIEIMSEDGGGRFTGYHTFLSKPGVKRIGLARASTVFTTFHSTSETDTDKLEDILTVNTYEEYEQFLIGNARDDYHKFLIEYSFTPAQVKVLVENEADQIPMPVEFNRLTIKNSPIHGAGMFLIGDVGAGEFLAPARLNSKRTPAGRYINHSPIPNVEFVPLENGDIHARSLRPIADGEEVTVNYRQAADVNGNKRGDL